MLKLTESQIEALRQPVVAGARDRFLSKLAAGGATADDSGPEPAIVLADKETGARSRMIFGPDGSPSAVISAAGRRYSLQYRGGLLTSLTVPGRNQYRFGYDRQGRLRTAGQGDLPPYQFEHDKRGEVSRIVWPDKRSVTFERHPNRILASSADRTNAVTRYDYDDAFRLTAIHGPLDRTLELQFKPPQAALTLVHPGGGRELFEKLADGRIRRQAPDRSRTDYRLGKGNRIEAIAWAGGKSSEFKYGSGGELQSARLGDGLVQFEHDGAGNIKSERSGDGVVEATWDKERRLTRLVTQAGDTTAFAYDPDGFITSVAAWDRIIRLTPGPDGQTEEIDWNRGLKERRKHGGIGRLEEAQVTTASGTVVSRQSYRYDDCERLREFHEHDRAFRYTRQLRYDEEDRLVSDEGGRFNLTYRYDQRGNMQEYGPPRSAVRIESGDLDEPARVNSRPLHYDPNGNLTRFESASTAGSVECGYNACGQLTECRTARAKVRFEYDALGRRTRKSSAAGVWRFGWFGLQLLWEEFTAHGKAPIRRDYLWAPGFAAPIAFRESGRVYWLQSDARGAVIRAFDEGGTVVWHGEYESFGKVSEHGRRIRQPWRLMGQYEDEETGLHFNLGRYYNPELRAYLTRDPRWYESGATNYSYARNDPWNKADPTGCLWQSISNGLKSAVSAVSAAASSVSSAVKSGFDAAASAAGQLVSAAASEIKSALPGIVPCGLKSLGAGLLSDLKGVGSWTWAFLGGVADATIMPIAHMIMHPFDTVAALGNALEHTILHPIDTAKAIGHGIGEMVDKVASGDPNAIGQVVGTVAMTLLTDGAGEAAVAADGAEAVTAVGDVAKVGEVSEEAAAAGKAGEAAKLEGDAAKAAEDLPKDPVEGCGPPNKQCEFPDREPVNSVTGAVFMSKQDFVLPGALQLELTRLHSSQLTQTGPFGPRWASTWGQYIEVSGDAANFYAADGRWIKFTLPRPGDREWVSRADTPGFRLRRTSTGFDVRDNNRHILRFNSAGASRYSLAEIENANGHSIRFRYDSFGGLRNVEHSGGYRLQVETSGGRIRRIDLVSGRKPIELVRYEYDRERRLAAVIDGSGLPFRYFYDNENRVVRWEDRNGTWYSYDYDSRGRCVRNTGSDNLYASTFEYDEKKRTNTVTDSLGGRQTYVYNEQQQVVARTDPGGNLIRYVWDGQSNKLEERDAAGRGVVQQFNPDGDLTRATDSLKRTTQIRYNARGLPEMLIDAEGGAWMRAWDDRDNLVEAKGPDGASWQYVRDKDGNVTRVIDPENGERRFGYDACGLLLWWTDARGNRSSVARDEMGRVISRKDPLGNETRFVYNALGKIASVELPDRTRLRYEYDAEGNILRRTGADGGVYQYTWGSFDLLEEIRKPSGGKIRMRYDTEARLTRVENEIGQLWEYQYNATGQVIRERDFHGRARTFEYDASGLCNRVINGAGEEIRLERDAAGQLVSKAFAAGADSDRLRFDYDRLGLITSAVRGTANVAFKRDRYGRVLREEQNGRVVESVYDKRGFRVKRSTELQDCEWSLDENGLPAALKLGGRELLAFEYDPLGREVERRMTGGATLRQEFDAMGRLTSQWAGVLAGRRDNPAIIQRNFRYDSNGDPVEITDSNWGVSRFRYDADGRIAANVRERGPAEEFAYDAAGNMAGATYAVAAANPVITDRTRFYDRNGRLERMGTAVYVWDSDGRLTEKRDAGQRWRYEWTPDGKLKSLQGPDGVRWTYTYDAFGRRLAKSGANGSTDFLWDRSVITGELSERGDVEWVHEPGSFRPLVRRDMAGIQQCITDQVGTPRELIGGDGTMVWSSMLSTWGEAEQAGRAPFAVPVRFQGQWADEESGLHYNVNRYYDPQIAEYLSPDPLGIEGGTRQYGYVHNPFSWVDPLGLISPPDDQIVVRGGQGPMPEQGTTFSGSYGATLEDAAKGVPHGTVRYTTVGDIKAQGGSVEIAPEEAYPGGPINEQHVNVVEGPGKSTFSDPIPNPIPKGERIPGKPKC